MKVSTQSVRSVLFICAGVLAVTVATTGCSDSEPIVSCDSSGGITPLCGYQNPEDLALLPGERAILVSEFGSMDGARAGRLASLDLRTLERAVLYESGGTATEGWGDPACVEPPSSSFSPHGIDIGSGPGGALALFVVNHGGRESIELFEIHLGVAGPALEWRGCAIPSAEIYMNDVAALPGGGFAATHMFDRTGTLSTILSTISLLFGSDTGYVVEWKPGAGFTKVEGTDGSFPNGISASRDGSELFVNMYAAGQVRRISRSTGELLGSAEITAPDNSAWAPDGRLLVASHTGGLSGGLACGSIESGTCPMEFAIVALDPQTMKSEVVLQHAGPPMGAATVALQVGQRLFLGTFAGDRIAVVDLSR